MLGHAARTFASKGAIRTRTTKVSSTKRQTRLLTEAGANRKTSPVPLGPVYAAIPTPLTADGALSSADIAHNIQKWNDTNLDGFLVLGSTGEAASLTFKERVEVLQTVKKEASPRKQLFAGTGSSSLKETKDLTAIAQDLGYDAALVVTPYFYINSLSDSALEAYYTSIADSAKIPIMLYNNPRLSGVQMSIPLIKKLSQHSNIVGIKDSFGSSEQLQVLLEETREHQFEVLGANGSTYLANLMAGVPGSIMALACVVPNHLAKIHELFEAKQFDEAAELQKHLVTLNHALTNKYGVPGIKYLLNKMGYKVGPTRLPLLPLSDKDTAALDKLFQQYQL